MMAKIEYTLAMMACCHHLRPGEFTVLIVVPYLFLIVVPHLLQSPLAWWMQGSGFWEFLRVLYRPCSWYMYWGTVFLLWTGALSFCLSNGWECAEVVTWIHHRPCIDPVRGICTGALSFYYEQGHCLFVYRTVENVQKFVLTYTIDPVYGRSSGVLTFENLCC